MCVHVLLRDEELRRLQQVTEPPGLPIPCRFDRNNGSCRHEWVWCGLKEMVYVARA